MRNDLTTGTKEGKEKPASPESNCPCNPELKTFPIICNQVPPSQATNTASASIAKKIQKDKCIDTKEEWIKVPHNYHKMIWEEKLDSDSILSIPQSSMAVETGQ